MPSEAERPALTEGEWKERYRKAFIDAGCSPEFALEVAYASDYEQQREGFEDDPEGAAQMEMSYWEE